MILKPPFTLNIGGMVWKVELSTGVAREGCVHGSTHYYTQTIYLDPGNTPQHMLTTFLHEVLHVLFNQSAIGPIIDGHDDKLNERIVTMLGFGLHQVLVDNGLLKLEAIK